MSRRNDAHKAMHQNITEENKKGYEDMINKPKKAVSKAARERRI